MEGRNAELPCELAHLPIAQTGAIRLRVQQRECLDVVLVLFTEATQVTHNALRLLAVGSAEAGAISQQLVQYVLCDYLLQALDDLENRLAQVRIEERLECVLHRSEFGLSSCASLGSISGA